MVHCGTDYVQELVVRSLRRKGVWTFVPPRALEDPEAPSSSAPPELQILPPKAFDWNAVFEHGMMGSRHYKRNGICRKDELAANLQEWAANNPDDPFDILAHVPLTVAGEGDSPEFWEEVAVAMERESGIWILKPSDSSNATAITVFSTLEVAKKVVADEHATSGDTRPAVKDGERVEAARRWVAQKYIERPLLVAGKKFHIRGWVLAQGCVSVYLHEYCMCLMSTQQYSTEEASFDNKAMHCTNHKTVQAHIEGYKFEENAIPFSELTARLHEQGQHLDVQDPCAIIFEQMKQLARVSLASVVGNRKKFFCVEKCFEYFGYDFLVDEDLQVWLLEVNATPDLSGFQKHTDLAKRVVEDIIALCVDPIYPPYGTKQEKNKGFHLVFQEEIKLMDCSEAGKATPQENAAAL